MRFKPSDLVDKNPLASMLGAEVPVENDETQIITAQQYDMLEFKKWAQAVVMPFVMVAAMHWYWKFFQPLFLLPVNQVMEAASHALTRIYVLKQSGDDLRRPFPKPKGFMDQIADAKKQAEIASGTYKEPKQKPNKAANLQAVRKNK